MSGEEPEHDSRIQSSSSSSSSSSSLSSDSNSAGPGSNVEEETVVLRDTDRISVPEASPSMAEDDAGGGFGDPESPNSKADSSSSSSSEGVLVERPTNADQEPRCLQGDADPDSGILVDIDASMLEAAEGEDEDECERGEDVGREVTFVDAPEELGFVEGRGGGGLEESMAVIEIGESAGGGQLVSEVARLRAQLDEAMDDCRKYREERDSFGREICSLRYQLQSMVEGHSLLAGGSNEMVLEQLRHAEMSPVLGDLIAPMPLHLMVTDCSHLASRLRSSIDDVIQSEATIRELHTVLYTKDQEIENLHGKIYESSISNDVVTSYLGSLRDERLETVKESYDLVTKRLLASLAPLATDTMESADLSFEEISLVEKKTSLFVEKHIEFLRGINQLRHCLTTVKPDFAIVEGKELCHTFDIVCEELLQSRNNESHFLDKINGLENEQREMLEQLDRTKESLDAAKSEASRTRVELQQVESRFLSAKEKLSIAVSKGKSLVQHRDSLKHSLAEKTGELDRCLQELQQKSEVLDATQEELKQSQDMVLSLQNTVLERDKILQEIAETVAQVDSSNELPVVDLIDRIRWLADQTKMSMELMLENQKLQHLLSSFDLPAIVLSTSFEQQINWLGESFASAKVEAIKLQNELAYTKAAIESCELELMQSQKKIESLTESLFLENQERYSLQVVHEDLSSSYEAAVEEMSRLMSEKNRLMLALGAASEGTMDDVTSGELDTFIEKSVIKIKERVNAVSVPSVDLMEGFDRFKSLLYVQSQELFLYEMMLKEAMNDKAEMLSLSSQLCAASEVMAAMRNEKDSLQNDLIRVEEKSSLLREKLSLAVKKGKGLVQEREGLKQSLDEKNSEIDKLKRELKLQESSLTEHKEQINILTADFERLQNLESDIVSVKVERDQIEHMMLESTSNLQKVMEAIEKIVLPSDGIFRGPFERVNQIAQHIYDSEKRMVYAEQELDRVTEEVTLQNDKFVDAFSTIKSLENTLSFTENRVSVILEEKQELLKINASTEQELVAVKEESAAQAGKLAQANETIKALKDALSKAEEKMALLMEERDELQSKSKQAIATLNAKLAACMDELAATHAHLENQSAEMASHIIPLLTLTKDAGLLPLLTEGFRKHIVSLKNVARLIQNVHSQIYEEGQKKQDGALKELLAIPKYGDYLSDIPTYDACTTKSEDGIPPFTQIAEEFSSQTKLLGERVSQILNFTEDHIKHLFGALQEMRDDILNIVELKESHKLNASKLEASNKAQEIEITTLQNDIKTLHSACSDAIQTLQIDFHQILPLDRGKNVILNPVLEAGKDNAEGIEGYVGAPKLLLLAARRIKTSVEQFEKIKITWTRTVEDLKNRLEEAELTAESIVKDNDLKHEKIITLERELDSLKYSCNKLKSKIKDYRDRESTSKQTESELLSIKHQLAMKNRDEEHRVSEGQLETLFDKVSKLEIPCKELEVEAQEKALSDPIDKMFYILSNFSSMQDVIHSMVFEKENLQSSLELREDEIERLKKSESSLAKAFQELKSKENDLNDLAMRLEELVQKLGGSDLLQDKRSQDANGFLVVLERLITSLSQESENFKLKAQELAAKLLASHKVADELSNRVKSLEDSLNARSSLPDTKERGIYESSSSVAGSEILEIEDVGPLGKKSISPVPPAPHARVMRKGSSDHISVNIDVESDKLISSYETDEKGRAFKSLNTSGIIPRQGKLLADRIDGIWVSGDRILMRRPGARVGLIAYWIMLHLWVLGTIV